MFVIYSSISVIQPGVHTPVYTVSPRWGFDFRMAILTDSEPQTRRQSPNGAAHHRRGCEPPRLCEHVCDYIRISVIHRQIHIFRHSQFGMPLKSVCIRPYTKSIYGVLFDCVYNQWFSQSLTH